MVPAFGGDLGTARKARGGSMAKTGGEGSGLTDLPPKRGGELEQTAGVELDWGWSWVCSTSPPQGFDDHRYIVMEEEESDLRSNWGPGVPGKRVTGCKLGLVQATSLGSGLALWIKSEVARSNRETRVAEILPTGPSRNVVGRWRGRALRTGLGSAGTGCKFLGNTYRGLKKSA